MEAYGATLAESAPFHSAMDFHKICCNFCPCENCIFIQAEERNPVEIRYKPFIFKIQNDIWKKTIIIISISKWENGGRSIKLLKDSCEHITECISCLPAIDPKPGIVTEYYSNHVAVWSTSLVFLRSWSISLLFLSYFYWDVNDLCTKYTCTQGDFFTIMLMRSTVKCEKTHTIWVIWSNLDLLTFFLFFLFYYFYF